MTIGGNSGAATTFDTGNVGIGTSSPAAKLDIRPVAFSANQAGGILLGNPTNTQWDTPIYIRSDSGGIPRLAIGGPGRTEDLTIYNDGNVGIGTTTPSHKLTVTGSAYVSNGLTLLGAFKDSTNATGTAGMILKTTGTSTQWVATSTLGLGNNTFLGLTDTPSSYTANRLIFTNSGATALTDSSDLTFDGTNLGLGSQNGIAFGGTKYLYASSTNDSVVFGENAGATFSSSTIDNIAIGYFWS